MKTLLIHGTIVNVFTSTLEKTNVLLEDDQIVGIGEYEESSVDQIIDLSSKYICPGFIDGHIHIESTMLTPSEFARSVLLHGTTAVIADPHEIANVAGTDGLHYMLEESKNVPMDIYYVLPSCVPATSFDENGATLTARDLEPFYEDPQVVGLGEVMSYYDVIHREPSVMEKIHDAKKHHAIINGHAPLLTGKDLDLYISAGIYDDHECSSLEEAQERIQKGQHVMIREGTAAQNLDALLPLFEEPWASRCMLVTDDRHPAELLHLGHIDHIIRKAAKAGKNPITGIRMATIQAAEYFHLQDLGAIAPGYKANLVILDDLQTVSICDVYHNGICYVKNKQFQSEQIPTYKKNENPIVTHSFHMNELTSSSFHIDCVDSRLCNIINLQKGELLTDIGKERLDFSKNNGIDIERDLLKIAVIERHHNTGHITTGFIHGTGLKCGAIASSVSHDSHNLIIIGTNDEEMVQIGNRICELEGGLAVSKNHQIIAEMPLPIAGLMSDLPSEEVAKQNKSVYRALQELGIPQDQELFMTMAFISLPVIPHIKITPGGLVDVDQQKYISLFANE